MSKKKQALAKAQPPAPLSRKGYEKQLAALHVELVKLQQCL